MNTIIFQYLYSFAHQSQGLDKVIVFFAHTFPYIVILLAGIFLLFSRRFSRDPDPASQASGHHIMLTRGKEIVLVFFSGIFAWCVANVIKIIIANPRPSLVLENIQPLLIKTGYSFPSGHATFFMALAFSIFFAHKKAGYLFMFFALVIGVARIMAGVHYPLDILAGFILGTLIAMLTKLFLLKKD